MARGWHDIHYAAFEGSLEKVSALISSGVPVDEVGPDGKSALHQAAGKGHLHVVNYLLQHKASPYLRDGKGRTPGEYARHCGQPAIDARLAEIDGRPVIELKDSDCRRIQSWIDQSPAPSDLMSGAVAAPTDDPRSTDRR